ncbi:hypothetical protein ACUR5C_04575 [Aliikangiella sp. IMCC44653]
MAVLLSVITGGKFANGAVTAAFSRVFNEEAKHQAEEEIGFFSNIKTSSDVFDVGGEHGDNTIMQKNSPFVEMRAENLWKEIQNHPNWKKGIPIRLWSCNTGSGYNSFAQQLSILSGSFVYAPNVYLGFYQNGDRDVNGGKFVGFYPDGE